METETVEKAAGVGSVGLWAALHGLLGWLVLLYAAVIMLDWLTGTALALKEKTWNSGKARQGLWHKCGSVITICVALLTDILLGLVLNNFPSLTLPFDYSALLTPLVIIWYIVSELGSILENSANMGAPIPGFLKSALEKVKASCDSAAEDENKSGKVG